MTFIIAIDGTAASGKGTLAKRIAAHYGYVHLDTGLLYRAVGLQLIEAGFSPAEAEDHFSEAAEFAINSSKNITIQQLNSENLGDEIVGAAASIVSAIPAVREALLAFQRTVAEDKRGAVLDGRDIGTVICPDANIKFFITATLETRAERRYKQLQTRDKTIIQDAVLMDLQRRDRRDMERDCAPLRPAEDAICIDTSNLTMDDVFAESIARIDAIQKK